MILNEKDWKIQRKTAFRDFNLPLAAGDFLQQRLDALGTGRTVWSDGMSLDATRHSWNVRVDPKRRAYGMGQYQHVLDGWGIIYNQPIVLGTRQAGTAI